jgi:hypothetical protein
MVVEVHLGLKEPHKIQNSPLDGDGEQDSNMVQWYEEKVVQPKLMSPLKIKLKICPTSIYRISLCFSSMG